MRAKDKVRRIKVGLLIVTLLIVGLYIANKWSLSNKFDMSYPEISFEQELLKVSVKATEEDLLQGVTAYDAKDGDVTESIIIESMSNLLEGNQRIVTYVAFDGDDHIGRAERRIQYTDYTPIRFSLTESLKSATTGTSWMDIIKPLHATDCIDGDITSDILLADYEIVSQEEEYALLTYGLQVTNSCGDMASLSLPVKVNMSGLTENNWNAEITLSDYLVYVKRGEKIDPVSFIESAAMAGEAYDTASVKITSDVSIWETGVYTVTYAIEEDGARATCYLIVVVEE